MGDSGNGVLILFNTPRPASASRTSEYAESDLGVLDEVEAVVAALASLGLPGRTHGVRCLEDVSTELSIASEPTVFNLVESLEGDANDFNFVPALCRAFSKGCTGSDSSCLIRCLDKGQTKAALHCAGVPVPESLVVAGELGDPPALPNGRLIVKPLLSEASEGIDADTVFDTPGPAVAESVRRIQERFRCPALVERFVDGREINVSVIEQDGKPVVLPLAEIEFRDFGPDRPRIVGYRAKWIPDSFEFVNTVRHVPADLPEPVADRIRRYARDAWRTLGCSDYARVDMRLDADLSPYVLEVNANPDITPEAGFASALAAAGIAYSDFVRTVVGNAQSRRAAAARGEPAPAHGGADGQGLSIRLSQPEDREAILAATAATRAFRPDEVSVARSVLDEALATGPAGQYQSYTAVLDGRPAGWVCFGRTPCTSATFDLYWIVVASRLQGRGIGRALMAHAEGLIAAAGGQLVIVETSGRPSYDATRAFYARLGYDEAARVEDFYAPGDAKIICTKRLAPAGA